MIRVVTRRKYQLWVCLALALAVCLLVVTPASSGEVLQTTLSNMQQSQQWWDKLWHDTFSDSTDPNSISIYTFATAVRFLLAVGLLFWLFQYGQKMAESKGMAQSISINTQFFIPVVLVMIFLSNQGQYSRLLAYGLRDIENSWTNGVLAMDIAGQNIRTALNDQLLTQDTKDVLAQQAQKCMQMPQPEVNLPSVTRPPLDPNKPPLTIQQEQAYDYLECIQKLGDLAEQKKQDALTKQCSNIQGVRGICSTFLKTVEKAKTGAEQNKLSELEKRTKNIPLTNRNPYASPVEMGDFLGGAITTAAYGPVLSWTQWLWTGFLEMAQWLSGLFAPMFIAVSLIPGRQNLFVTWLIGFLTIGLAKLAYVVVIGVVAAQLSDQAVIFGSDMRFPMALGLFAPAVSFAVVTGGGLAAASSFRNQGFAVAGAVGGAVTSAFAGVAYSYFRYSDRSR